MTRRYVMMALLVTACAIGIGCTNNQMAKNYGGTMTISLPQGERLVTATWKNDDLWYLTEPMGVAEPRTLTFKEQSAFGVLEGTVIFKETR